ncbi:aspartate carbamoyltransferase catalytic subunit [Thiohalorhabdus methylotrophus]|uniref:Aspartate carbamoyltransferase n=1 Tax=Thiohalorhabdus methylotrophus TaxID=3242694 RepID=A0ABV4TY49_9GAMM
MNAPASPAAPDALPRHFLGLEGVSAATINRILEEATRFRRLVEQPNKKADTLKGRTVINLFFESSTRTRTSFELAGKRLSADVININASASATQKGETWLDTVRTLEAMTPDALVIRHAESGTPHMAARALSSHCSVINAGDGTHEHPTQALLDILTIQHHKGPIEGLRVAIVGDAAHSRVARSQIHALHTMGAAEIRLVGPKTLIPARAEEALGVQVFHDADAGLEGADVIIMLRMQLERIRGAAVPSQREYFRLYGLDRRRVARAADDVLVMHPGPMNRGVEIASEVADGPYSVILPQVTNGLAIRMAVLKLLAGGESA